MTLCRSADRIVHRTLPLRLIVLVAVSSSCACQAVLANDRVRGGIQRAEHRPANLVVQRTQATPSRDADAPRDFAPPPYLSRTRNGDEDAGAPGAEMGVQDSRPAGRLSPEERRQLRKTIQDAGRDVYKR